ncbi:MAG TPA: sigma factor [Bacillales bacterium]|nr:sigma factor [Bacillales bacterium]
MSDEEKLKNQILRSNKEKAIEEIKRFIFTYVKNWSYTDDIVQDVFLAVYLNFDTTYKEKCKIKTWILTIAANKAKDFLKSSHYKRVALTNRYLHQTNTQTPETSLMQNQMK